MASCVSWMTRLHWLRWEALILLCDPFHRMIMLRQFYRLNRDCVCSSIRCFYLQFNSSFSTSWIRSSSRKHVCHLLYRPLTTPSSRSVITIMETALGTPSPSCLCQSSLWSTMQALSPIRWAGRGLWAVGATGQLGSMLWMSWWTSCKCREQSPLFVTAHPSRARVFQKWGHSY